MRVNRPCHRAIALMRRLLPGVMFSLVEHKGSWAFVGPQWELLDPVSGLIWALMSPVIAPEPTGGALLLSVCDTTEGRIGKEAVDAIRIPRARTAKETARELATAYYELAQAVELSGIEALV